VQDAGGRFLSAKAGADIAIFQLEDPVENSPTTVRVAKLCTEDERHSLSREVAAVFESPFDMFMKTGEEEPL
jgi:hypothetical protein